MVKLILQLEGLAIFIGCLYIYHSLEVFGVSWVFFLATFMLPDISILGYSMNKSWGALIYNLVHNYASAFLVIFLGLISGHVYLFSFGFVMVAHTGLDRFLGFGLKYEKAFKESHLQRV